MIALVALGNRTSGDTAGSHLLGAVLMTMGIWIGTHTPVWHLVPILGGVFIFRLWSSRPFFHTFQYGQWEAAFKRAAWVVLPAAIVSLLHHTMFPYLKALLAVPLLPAIYWLSNKIAVRITARYGIKDFTVELAELLVGAALGVTCL